jgi:hypothetical protein
MMMGTSWFGMFHERAYSVKNDHRRTLPQYDGLNRWLWHPQQPHLAYCHIGYFPTHTADNQKKVSSGISVDIMPEVLGMFSWRSYQFVYLIVSPLSRSPLLIWL